MKYPIVIHHDEGSAYGVTVPDLPGCFSAGDTIEEAFDNAVEAIYFHLEGLEEDGEPIPVAESVDYHSQNADFDGGTWGLVEVDITKYLGRSEKINVTLPSSLVRKIDAKHGNRSKFLAEAAINSL